MRKLLAALFTILLVFAPVVATAKPYLTEDKSLVIQKEDLHAYVTLFTLLVQYDKLLNEAMGSVYSIAENFRAKVNEKVSKNELSEDVMTMVSTFFSNYHELNNRILFNYSYIANAYNKITELAYPVVAEVVQYLEEIKE